MLQRITGDGMAFLHAYGTVVRKVLRGNTIIVDTGCIVAMGPGVDYSVKFAGGIPTMAFAGEGAFVTKLSGMAVSGCSPSRDPPARIPTRPGRRHAVGGAQRGDDWPSGDEQAA